MIVFDYKIGRIPVGRDIKHIKADFFDGTVPSWLSGTNAVVANNCLSISAGSMDVNLPVIIKNAINVGGTTKSLFLLESLAFKVNNFRVLNGLSSSSIELVSSTGWKLGLYGVFASSNDKHNYFKVTDSNGNVIVNELVGTTSGGTERSVMISPTDVAYQTRPKNIEFVIQPEIGNIHICTNDSVAYSYWNLADVDIDWTGEWKFQITSNSAMCMSSIEMELQQNI